MELFLVTDKEDIEGVELFEANSPFTLSAAYAGLSRVGLRPQ